MKNLIKKGLINTYILFLENYKNIKITDQEAVLLLHVFKLQEDPKYTLVMEDFEKYTSLKKKKIEELFSSLVKKGLITVKFKKGWIIDTNKIWDKIIDYVETRKDQEHIDTVVSRVEKITNTSLKTTEVKFLEKVIGQGHYDQIDELIAKLQKNNQDVNFQVIEETITINIDKLKNLDDEVIDYNWLANK